MIGRIRDSLRTSEGLLALVSIILLGISAAVAVEPTLVPPTVREPILAAESGRTAWLLTVALGMVFGMYTLWRLYRPGSSYSPPTGQPSFSRFDHPPAGDVRTVGADRTAMIESAIDDHKHDRGRAADRAASTAAIQDQLATLGHTILTSCGMDSGTATAAIERGEWTHDPVAAAFLGTEAAPDFPFSQRLLGWLVPGYALERRIEHTVTALEAIAEGEDG